MGDIRKGIKSSLEETKRIEDRGSRIEDRGLRIEDRK
jgi:hypothetical protein